MNRRNNRDPVRRAEVARLNAEYEATKTSDTPMADALEAIYKAASKPKPKAYWFDGRVVIAKGGSWDREDSEPFKDIEDWMSEGRLPELLEQGLAVDNWTAKSYQKGLLDKLNDK